MLKTVTITQTIYVPNSGKPKLNVVKPVTTKPDTIHSQSTPHKSQEDMFYHQKSGSSRYVAVPPISIYDIRKRDQIKKSIEIPIPEIKKPIERPIPEIKKPIERPIPEIRSFPKIKLIHRDEYILKFDIKFKEAIRKYRTKTNMKDDDILSEDIQGCIERQTFKEFYAEISENKPEVLYKYGKIKMDPFVEEFINKNYIISEDKTPSYVIYNHYKTWMEANNPTENVKVHTTFGKIVNQISFNGQKMKTYYNGKNNIWSLVRKYIEPENDTKNSDIVSKHLKTDPNVTDFITQNYIISENSSTLSEHSQTNELQSIVQFRFHEGQLKEINRPSDVCLEIMWSKEHL